MGETQASRPRFHNLEHLIAELTLAVGFVAAIFVGLFQGWVWGAGIGIGAVLAWLNFRWLKHAIGALSAAATAQSNQQKARVPLGAYFLAMFRYALIAIAVYVIFKYLRVPILSMIAGLFALGAATLVACLYEILRPVG
ncbi:MAG: ATP synthase subunit I [Candidatus Acidiferrum sp.]